MVKEWGFVISILALVYTVFVNTGGGQQSFITRRALYARQKKEIWRQMRKVRHHRPWHRNRVPSKHRFTHILGNAGKDVIDIHKNLFS
ncbi:MAG: hypothetical protein CUN55_21320, partial [Phototrophicales bacterium]